MKRIDEDAHHFFRPLLVQARTHTHTHKENIYVCVYITCMARFKQNSFFFEYFFFGNLFFSCFNEQI